jgi:hypothetical protein
MLDTDNYATLYLISHILICKQFLLASKHALDAALISNIQSTHLMQHVLHLHTVAGRLALLSARWVPRWVGFEPPRFLPLGC